MCPSVLCYRTHFTAVSHWSTSVRTKLHTMRKIVLEHKSDISLLQTGAPRMPYDWDRWMLDCHRETVVKILLYSNDGKSVPSHENDSQFCIWRKILNEQSLEDTAYKSDFLPFISTVLLPSRHYRYAQSSIPVTRPSYQLHGHRINCFNWVTPSCTNFATV